MAKKQSQELQRTSEFFDSLLTLEVVKREPEIKHAEQGSNSPMIDSGVAMESPQFEHAYSAGSERSKHIVIIPEETRNGIPSSPTQTKSRSEKSPKSDKPEPPQHLFSLVSQLRDARLELEAKSAKMRELEELLRKERTAREMAEDRAAQLELASLSLRKQERQLKENLNRTRASEDSIDLDDDQADDISIAGSEDTVLGLDLDFNEKRNLVRDEATVAAAEAAAQLQKKVEEMMAELEQAKEEIESYRQRVRTAEEDGEKSRKSLAEMVATLRADEERRRKSAKSHGIQTDSAPRPVLAHFGVQTIVDIEPVTPATVIETGGEGAINANGSIMKLANGSHKKLSVMELPGNTKLMKQAHSRSMSSQSAPYVSIVSVVIIGVGIMAVLNSWQKGER